MSAASNDRRQALQMLSAEFARLAGSGAAETEVLGAVLARLIAATESPGGAMWVVARRNGSELTLKLAASQALDDAAGHAESAQRQQVLRAASEVILSSQPLVLMPAPAGQEAVTPGVLVNQGPFAIVGVPLRSGDDHLGAVQLWFPASSDPAKLAELALMLQALMAELGPRLRSRQMRELGAQSQRQQQLLQMAHDLTGLLDAHEGARLASAHVRELLGINRVSFLIRQGDRWQVIGISGQPQVETRSEPVTRMLRLAREEAGEQIRILARGETAGAATWYLADSPMQSAVLVPLRDGAEGTVFGVMLGESTDVATFGPPGLAGDPRPPGLVLAQWLAELAGKSLRSALRHQSLPMATWLAKLGHWREEATSTQKRRRWTWLIGTVALLAVALLWPLRVKVEGDCLLLPRQRALITPEAPGRVEEVLVREGEHVTKDQVLARLDTRRLRSEWEATTQARRRLEAEVERQRGQGKEALARIASLEAQATAETEKRLQLEIELAVLRAPITGVVMTREIHLRTGMFLEAGEIFAEVATLDGWDLRLEIPEAEMAEIETALAARSPRDVRYLLYTQSARELSARLEGASQISPALQTGKDGGVFQITLPNVETPVDMQPQLRPGLTGRAKIELDPQAAGQVLLRKFTRWLRMHWWL